MIKNMLNTILFFSVLNLSCADNNQPYQELSDKEIGEMQTIAKNINKENWDERYDVNEKIEVLNNNRETFKLSKTIWLHEPDMLLFDIDSSTAESLNWTYLNKFFSKKHIAKIMHIAWNKVNNLFSSAKLINCNKEIEVYYIKSVAGILINARIDKENARSDTYYLLLHHNDDHYFGLTENTI